MITADSIHALQRVIALQNRAPLMFADSSSLQRNDVFMFDYQTYALELSDTSASIVPISRIEEEESLRKLYAEFETEDRQLANFGLGQYQQMLSEIEGSGE